eukprot:1771781-Rhodomonas_salina.1
MRRKTRRKQKRVGKDGVGRFAWANRAYADLRGQIGRSQTGGSTESGLARAAHVRVHTAHTLILPYTRLVPLSAHRVILVPPHDMPESNPSRPSVANTERTGFAATSVSRAAARCKGAAGLRLATCHMAYHDQYRASGRSHHSTRETS